MLNIQHYCDRDMEAMDPQRKDIASTTPTREGLAHNLDSSFTLNIYTTQKLDYVLSPKKNIVKLYMAKKIPS